MMWTEACSSWRAFRCCFRLTVIAKHYIASHIALSCCKKAWAACLCQHLGLWMRCSPLWSCRQNAGNWGTSAQAVS